MNPNKWKSVLTDKEFIANIKAGLLSADMTQEEFSAEFSAESSRLSETLLSHALTGKRMKALYKIANYFGYEHRLVRVKK